MIVEYLGLPGSGKSWQVRHGEFRIRRNAVAHSVPMGKDRWKVINTLFAALANLRLVRVLAEVWYVNRRTRKSARVQLRPFLVVLERYGRRRTLVARHRPSEVHLDEGVFQFLWRVFSVLEPSDRNEVLLRDCVRTLKSRGGRLGIAYLRCRRDTHLQRVRSRRKAQFFDDAVIAGDSEAYQRARWWMGRLLRYLRKEGYSIFLMPVVFPITP